MYHIKLLKHFKQDIDILIRVSVFEKVKNLQKLYIVNYSISLLYCFIVVVRNACVTYLFQIYIAIFPLKNLAFCQRYLF